MLGNIFGDIVGSVFEFANIYTKDFRLFSHHSYPTDDTICSVAVADWLTNGGDISLVMRQWCTGYPNAGYGSLFRQWLESEDNSAYGSRGNGAPMRVGPVALWFKNPAVAYVKAVETASITHNDLECYDAVKAVVAIQRYAAAGADMAKLKEIACRFYGSFVLTDIDAYRNRSGPHFDPFAKGTVIQALICFFCSNSVEDTIRNCISIGGDCDTSACIAGGIAEAYYGTPEPFVEKIFERLPHEMRKIVIDYYARRAIKPVVLDPHIMDLPLLRPKT